LEGVLIRGSTLGGKVLRMEIGRSYEHHYRFTNYTKYEG